jgi:hypothetical protein
MLVEFRRTGVRRYGVFVERERAPGMWVSPAVGFDEWLPHDLLHFVGEAEWGMDGAVFGQLASGGDPGIFIPTDERFITAGAMRKRKRAQRGNRPRGRRSELIVAILEYAWRARRGLAPLPADWDERLAAARVEQDKLEAVMPEVDRLAEQWHALRIGESLTLEWPRPEGRRRHRANRERRNQARRSLAR